MRITLELVKDYASAVYPPADWSIVSVPESLEQTKTLSSLLYNTSVSNHVVVALSRNSRRKRLDALGYIKEFTGNWDYLDSVFISYPKTSTHSSGFVPLAEMANIFYKGVRPNIPATSWFSGDVIQNAGNLWDLSSQPNEDKLSFQKFSWEMNLIILSMISPMEQRKFVYAVDCNTDDVQALIAFCKKFELSCHLCTTDENDYRKFSNIIKGAGLE